MALKTICLVIMFAELLVGSSIYGKQEPSSETRSFKTFRDSPSEDFPQNANSHKTLPADDFYGKYLPQYPNKLYSIIIIIFAVSAAITTIIIYLVKSRKMRKRYIQWLSEYLHDVQLLHSRFNESRKITETLFDNSKDTGMMIKIYSDDLTTRIVCTRINRAFEEEFSTTFQQASGKELNILLPELDYTQVYSAMHEPDKIATHHFEYCYKTDKFFIVTISRYDKASAYLRFTDITTDKQLISTLSEKLKYFDLATTIGNQGVWSWNIHNDSLYLSTGYKKMLGYEEHELPSRIESVGRLLHPEDKGYIIDHFYRCINGSISNYAIEFRMKMKNGKWCWLKTNTLVIRNSKGAPYQLIGIHMDITEEKLIRDEFKIISDNSPLPLIILDEFQRIKKVNRKAKEFRNNRSEAIGLRIGEWLRCKYCRSGCGKSLDCLECKLTKLLATSKVTHNIIGPQEITIDSWQDNGQRYYQPLRLAVSIMSFFHDTKNCAAIWLEDISQQKQADNNCKMMMHSMRQLNKKLNVLQLHIKALRKRTQKAEADHGKCLNEINPEKCIPSNGIINTNMWKDNLSTLPYDHSSSPETEITHYDDIVLSKDKLLRKSGMDLNQIQSIINGFIREIPIIIANIEEHITTEDMASAGIKARIIKDSASDIGAVKLQKAAEKLELMTEKGDFSKSINTMLSLETEFECVKSAFRDFLLKYSSNS